MGPKGFENHQQIKFRKIQKNKYDSEKKSTEKEARR